jgi:protein MpaA
VLVVGVIHGNEPAGAAIARDLVADPPPARARLVVVPSLNPDGMRAATRQNARGVDLNRNFPYRFHRIGAPFDEQYPGPAPLSEPESRFAATLIERVRPAVSVWFHQPLRLVDLSGGNAAVERSFARLVHLPPVQLTRYPGSVAGWQNHRFPGTTSFVVELPRGRLRPADVERYADAILRLAEALPPRSRSG